MTRLMEISTLLLDRRYVLLFPFSGFKNPFSGMKSVPDLMLELVLYHAHKAQWPPYTYIVFELLESTASQ